MKRIVALLIIVATVIGISAVASAAPKKEVSPRIDLNWTIEETASQNGVSGEVLLRNLELPDNQANRAAKLSSLNVSEEQADLALRKAITLKNEGASKNWQLIVLKFGLWWMLVIGGIVLLTRNLVTPVRRKWLLLLAVLVFGVFLGSDPSPMGTVKDTIALYGIERVFFPPRLVAFAVFTAMVIVGNKMICGWGCQFGTLQDLIGQMSPIKQKLRVPFKWSQRIRVTVFIVFSLAAFLLSVDLIGVIDPFMIYAPAKVTFLAGIFIALLLLLSLVTYRPWCTFACPFGLTGWFFERFALYRVHWDEKKCIACGTCKRICPSQHTIGLLAGEKHPADCYSCGACLKACPVGALKYARKKEQN